MSLKYFLAFISFLLMTFTSCKDKGKDVLVIADHTNITRNSNSDFETISSSAIGALLFNSLGVKDVDGTWHNHLIEEINVLSGSKEMDLRLRRGVRFHDGKEMTSGDIIPLFRSKIEGTKPYSAAYKGLKVFPSGEWGIRITSERPIADIPHLLSEIIVRRSDTISGLQASWLETVSNDEYIDVSRQGFIGTGPYKVARWLKNGLELEANDDYFEGKPKIGKIRYIYEEDENRRVGMLLKGEADLLVWLSPKMAQFLRKDGRFHVGELVGNWYTALFLNNESPLLKDRDVRRALSLAIDRKRVIEKGIQGGGKIADGPFLSPLSPQKETTSILYAPLEAAAILKRTGWRDRDGDGILEKDGQKLAIKLLYDEGEGHLKRVSDLISQSLFEVGVVVNSAPVNISDIGRTVLPEDYDALLHSKITRDNVNFATWHSSADTNISRYRNMDMDILLERLKEANRLDKKMELYGKMRAILNQEVPALFLFNPIIYSAVSKRFIGGEEFIGHTYSVHKIKDWSVNEDVE